MLPRCRGRCGGDGKGCTAQGESRCRKQRDRFWVPQHRLGTVLGMRPRLCLGADSSKREGLVWG